MGEEPGMVVDNSILRATARCTTEAVIRYHWGYTAKDAREAMQAGKAVHTALDVYLDPVLDVGPEVRRRAALAQLDRFYKDWAVANVTEERLRWENIRAIVETWMAQNAPAELPFKMVRPEVGFRQPLAPGVEVVGRLDGLVLNRLDGEWWVLEVKTTGRLTSYWAAKWQWDSQLTTYTWGAEAELGKPIRGVFILAVELPPLPTSDRKCTTHKGMTYRECGRTHFKTEIVPHTRSVEQIADWKRSAVELVEKFRFYATAFAEVNQANLTRLPMEGMFHGACQFCEFNKVCHTGKQMRTLEMLCVVDPWDPLADLRRVSDHRDDAEGTP